jgi:putative N-acetylmannosamine-6-phosphate epimerase
MITIEGLSKQDVQICNLLWNCDSIQAVDAMIAAMPAAYKQRAQSLRELMTAAALDNVKDIHEDTATLLQRISSL